MDLSEAFDTIDHNILISRLENRFHVTGPVLAWFESYLKDRHQSVCIGNDKSDYLPLNYGVPQGSVLGPLLFVIYTTPLGDIIQKYGLGYHMYADDTQLYLSFHPQKDQDDALSTIQQCLVEIKHWMHVNLLKLNADKTDVVVFGTKKKVTDLNNFSVSMDQCAISPSPSARNLGIIYDSTLNMEEHVSKVCCKAYMQLKNIGRIRRYLTEDATKSLAHAFVCSHLDYGNSLLYGLPGTLLGKLQRVQNLTARIVTCTPKTDHIKPILKTLHWLTIHRRIEFKILLFVYQCLNNIAPPYLKNLLDLYTPPRQLRSCQMDLLKVPRSRLVNYGDRSFSVAAPQLWNSIPTWVKEAKSTEAFKKKLKTFFFSQEYNS